MRARHLDIKCWDNGRRKAALRAEERRAGEQLIPRRTEMSQRVSDAFLFKAKYERFTTQHLLNT